MTRTRIVLTAPSLEILGGQAVQAHRLLRRLQTIDWLDVQLVPINPRLPWPFFYLKRVKYLRTVLHSVGFGGLLLAKVSRADIVHVFSASYSSYVISALPAILIGRLFRKRVLVNYRSGEAPDHLNVSRLARRTLGWAHQIVVPSQFLVDVFGGFGLAARPVPNFVEPSELRFKRRKVFRPVFLSNRNLEPLYNVRCTLRAFARVQAHLPDAELWIAGDGSERKNLEELSTLLALRNVHFLGKVAPSTMPELYARCDIYLNSPHIDNMPNSILEAFATGLVVVTTDAGGIPYIAQNNCNAFVVRSNDDTALASKALTAITNPHLSRAIVERAYQDVQERYTWSVVAPQWEAVYHDVMECGT